MPSLANDPESRRLQEDERRSQNWKRWGPYLAERQWGTVREDYSAEGEAWRYFPHDHARSRAYRWGEDGLLGICDRQARLCFALALWNGEDEILKERLFGLTGPEGNHGEDVKEQYFYLASTPTHSFMKGLYKYPQRAFPYGALVEENRRRTREDPELELADTGAFDDGRYFDVFAEYAKASPDDILIRLTCVNRGDRPAPLHLLPTLWFRNTWAWGHTLEDYGPRPRIEATGGGELSCHHHTLGHFVLTLDSADAGPPRLLFTENETNHQRLHGSANGSPYVKDAFHDYVIRGLRDRVSPVPSGTKAGLCLRATLEPAQSWTVRLRLRSAAEPASASTPFADFAEVFAAREREAEAFYESRIGALSPEQARVSRQAYAGLFWTKQFYHYDLRTWLAGDPAQPAPSPTRRQGRNAEWGHLYNRDIISMPDKWEYPWYAAWDLAFHTVAFARTDPAFAKQQLILLLREWYMHPNGQLPAYEFALDDVNPPVHAWAVWRVYKIAHPRDRAFLERAFHKLLLNFTWWVNRKDHYGRNLFAGGFLGLDNIGVFDRSRGLPRGGYLEQADATAWMAFYCGTMLAIALELASDDPTYDDLASKFFEHFVAIADAINSLGGTGLWDEGDGFYYDLLHLDGKQIRLRTRSLVGLLPLIAVEVLEQETIDRLPLFKKRMRWFLEHRSDLAHRVTFGTRLHGHALLAIPSRKRLERVLRYLLDEGEFLSPFGFRSLSRIHQRQSYAFAHDGRELRVDYVPGESNSDLFGGNSNWRGPVWFPVNYLLLEALERYHHFYGEELTVEYPTGSGRRMTLEDVTREVKGRLVRLFLPDSDGHRPCHGGDRRFAEDAHWRDLVHFYEYFNPETGRGLGASHQTGWTALVVRFLEDLAREKKEGT